MTREEECKQRLNSFQNTLNDYLENDSVGETEESKLNKRWLTKEISILKRELSKYGKD